MDFCPHWSTHIIFVTSSANRSISLILYYTVNGGRDLCFTRSMVVTVILYSRPPRRPVSIPSAPQPSSVSKWHLHVIMAACLTPSVEIALTLAVPFYRISSLRDGDWGNALTSYYHVCAYFPKASRCVRVGGGWGVTHSQSVLLHCCNCHCVSR